ncbi:VIN3-like protein 2 [Vitis vinifera]|uniref:VIN3-like protein 2 n=1 Tax=Vitis vinifera TaxID=29760 RepID=A0A438H8F7_VITVI|nr:VIN3-like protein 2 [Vitis vinifera]
MLEKTIDDGKRNQKSGHTMLPSLLEPKASGMEQKTRGIVNRLSSGPEVQRLCALALESLDSVLSNSHPRPAPGPKIQDAGLVAPSIRFEDVCSASLTVILGSEDSSTDNVISYKLWHRKSNDLEYPAEPACTMLAPNKRFTFSDLTPSTEYVFKVVSFQDTRELGMGEVQFSTSSSGDDIPKSLVAERSQAPPPTNENREDNYPGYCKGTDKTVSTNLSNEATNCTGTDQEGNPADSVFVSDDERDLRVVVSMPKVLKPDNKPSLECQIIEEMSTDKESNTPVRTGMECVALRG